MKKYNNMLLGENVHLQNKWVEKQGEISETS